MIKIVIIYFITQAFFFGGQSLAKVKINQPSLGDLARHVESDSNQNSSVKKQAKHVNDARKVVCTKSIRSNFRKGPDVTSPVQYEILVRGYPLRVIKFIDTWYATEDFEGNIAWISQINVKEHCGAIVNSTGLTFVYFSPLVKSKVLMSLQRGFIIHSVECLTEEWCSVKIDEKTGWVLKENLWGV